MQKKVKGFDVLNFEQLVVASFMHDIVCFWKPGINYSHACCLEPYSQYQVHGFQNWTIIKHWWLFSPIYSIYDTISTDTWSL